MTATMETYKQPFDDLMAQIRAMKKRSDQYEMEEREEGNIDDAGMHLRVSSVLAELERLGGEFEKRALAAGQPPRLPTGLPPGCLPDVTTQSPL